MECQVCLEQFNPAERRPKSLPCGHTFCLRCLQQLYRKQCPFDSKVFETSPEQLVDNYSLLQECNKPVEPASRRFWCLDCQLAASDACIEEHSVCSLRKARAAEAERLLEALERNRLSLGKLAARMADARGLSGVEHSRRLLEQRQAQLAALMVSLRDAQGADAEVWEQVKQAAEQGGQPHVATQLLDDLDDPSVECSLVVVRRGAGGGVAWRGDLRPADDVTARLLLCRLACSGGLQHQDLQEPAALRWQERSNEGECRLTEEEMAVKLQVGSRVARGRDWNPGWTSDGTPPGPGTVLMKRSGMVTVQWDRSGYKFGYSMGEKGRYHLRLLPTPLEPLVGAENEQEHFLSVEAAVLRSDLKYMSTLLTDGSLDQVRFLAGLHCDTLPPFSQKVLEQVAPRLEGLQMVSPLPRHLDVVLAMPYLQDLSITGVTGEQLQLVSQMASLRRLELHCTLDAPLPVLTFPAAAAGAGLRWLRCGVHPLVTALSLARAHADSLEELQLVAASVQPYGCPDLAHEIQGCGLKKLRKLVLLRQTGYETYCVHSLDSCVAQIQKLWNMFLDCNVDVFTFCSECNECFKNQNM